jgi:cobalt-zinc-cadmium efflux system outer membrane protein
MSRILVLFLGIAVLISIMSCSSSRRTANIPEPRPLVKNYQTDSASIDQEYEEEVNSTKQDTLTMSDAIQLALLKNPELQSYSIEIRAREARTLQESFAPNPDIEVEIENFGGSGEFNGFKGSEYTFSVGQLIELAGKRNKRTRAAAFQSDLAAWDYEAKKLDIVTETVKQYLQLIGDQEQIGLNEELVMVSERLHQAVNRLVQAGKISPAEISRTQILLSTAKLELNRSRRKLEADHFRLSSLWGATSPGFNSVTGSLNNVIVIPPVDSLMKYMAENPGQLSIDIYNILGERIKTYEKINLNNTEHTFNWNARSYQNEVLPSGEYILYIQFTDRQLNQKFTEVKKILYLK